MVSIHVRLGMPYQGLIESRQSHLIKECLIVVQSIPCVSCGFHQGVFSEVVGGKRRRPQENEETEKPTLKKSKAGGKDEEFYIPYRPKDFDSERG